MLDACGTFFDRGIAKKKLDFFLTFFEVWLEWVEMNDTDCLQYYLHTKDALPMEIDFMVKDLFVQIRPDRVMVKSAEQATQAFADAVAQNFKASEADKVAELEIEDEGASPDEVNEDEPAVADAPDGELSSDEVEVPVCSTCPMGCLRLIDHKIPANDAGKDDSDFDEKFTVTRPEEERDPEADAEFDRELARMQSESLDSRKFDRKPLFDVPLPMRRAQRDKAGFADDSPNEDVPAPINTVAFSLMTRKGNRQQVRVSSGSTQADSYTHQTLPTKRIV